MYENIIAFTDIYINLFIGSWLLALIVIFRNRLYGLIFVGLLITLNIKTFWLEAFGYNIIEIIAFERWVFFFGLILIGLIFSTKKIKMAYGKYVFTFYLVYFVMIFISSIYSLKPLLSLQRGFAMLLLIGATFYGIYNRIEGYKDIYNVYKALVLLAIIINVIPWFTMREDISHLFIQGRYAGIIRSATGSAALNIFLYPLTLSIYHISRRRLYLLAICVLIIHIFISYTRSAFIVLIFCTIFYYTQYYKKSKYTIVAFFISLVIMIGISFIIFGIWFPKRLIRVESLFLMGGRLEAWPIALAIISKKVWLGFGFGMEPWLFEHFKYVLKQHAGDYFHNSFLGLAAQLGVPFTIFYFTGLFLYFLITLKFTSTIREPTKRILAIGLNSTIMIGLFYCFVESYIYSPGNPFNFIFFLSCATLLRMISFEKALSDR